MIAWLGYLATSRHSSQTEQFVIAFVLSQTPMKSRIKNEHKQKQKSLCFHVNGNLGGDFPVE